MELDNGWATEFNPLMNWMIEYNLGSAIAFKISTISFGSLLLSERHVKALTLLYGLVMVWHLTNLGYIWLN